MMVTFPPFFKTLGQNMSCIGDSGGHNSAVDMEAEHLLANASCMLETYVPSAEGFHESPQSE